MMVTVRERRGIDLGGVGWALAGRIVGTLPAAAVLAVLPQSQLSRVFGLMVILAVVISVSGVHVRPRPSTLLAGGVLSGLMGTVAAIGGPPIALLYQHASGTRFRATLSSLFFVGTIISIAALVPAGRFGGPELRLTLLLLPGAAFGFLVSRRLASRLGSRLHAAGGPGGGRDRGAHRGGSLRSSGRATKVRRPDGRNRGYGERVLPSRDARPCRPG